MFYAIVYMVGVSLKLNADCSWRVAGDRTDEFIMISRRRSPYEVHFHGTCEWDGSGEVSSSPEWQPTNLPDPNHKFLHSGEQSCWFITLARTRWINKAI